MHGLRDSDSAASERAEIPDGARGNDTDVVEAPPRVESFILLKQSDSTYRVENTAQLQRWIAERRIWPDDEVAIDGGDWQRIGDIDAYAVFFRLVEEAERSLSGATATAPASVEPRRYRRHRRRRSVIWAPTSPSPACSPGCERDAHSRQQRGRISGGGVSLPSQADEAAEASNDGSPSPKSKPIVEPAALSWRRWKRWRMSRGRSTGCHAGCPRALRRGCPRGGEPGFLPTSPMDMELEEDDSSEEHSSSALSAGAGFDDDDDLGEWGQHRQEHGDVVAHVFGALGGAAYLALDFLNARDAQVQVAPEASSADANLRPRSRSSLLHPRLTTSRDSETPPERPMRTKQGEANTRRR